MPASRQTRKRRGGSRGSASQHPPAAVLRTRVHRSFWVLQRPLLPSVTPFATQWRGALEWSSARPVAPRGDHAVPLHAEPLNVDLRQTLSKCAITHPGRESPTATRTEAASCYETSMCACGVPGRLSTHGLRTSFGPFDPRTLLKGACSVRYRFASGWQGSLVGPNQGVALSSAESEGVSQHNKHAAISDAVFGASCCDAAPRPVASSVPADS